MAKKAIINASNQGMLSRGLVEGMYKAMEKFDADSCVVTTATDDYAEIDLFKGKECVEWAYVIIADKKE